MRMGAAGVEKPRRKRKKSATGWTRGEAPEKELKKGDAVRAREKGMLMRRGPLAQGLREGGSQNKIFGGAETGSHPTTDLHGQSWPSQKGGGLGGDKSRRRGDAGDGWG